ncbi:glycosyltransferase family 2 protein [Pseudomonas sp. FIP_A4]|uniref:glycosyltransferase family 2 protein n=1 Tax=Pseudomonas sp. FIP_A4 TaxID=3070684 RepID=UPI002FD773AB
MISIVLPIYNVSQYIERCLTSCVNQTCGDIEIVAVDDCGKDDSILKVERFAEKDGRIKIVKNKKNMGTYHARRIGVENAGGEYILFLDPDDELKLNAIEEILKCLSVNPDLIFYGVQNSPPKRLWQSVPVVPVFLERSDYISDINKILSCKGLQFGTAGKVMRRDILLKSYALLNIEVSRRLIFAEDVLLFSAVLVVMKKCASLKDRLYVYHANKSSVSSVVNHHGLLENVEQIEFVIKAIENIPISSVSDGMVRSSLIRALEVDRFRIRIKAGLPFFDAFAGYVSIILRTKSFKDISRLLLFVTSFGGKRA